MKKYRILYLFIISLLLTACGQDNNPLITLPPEQAAKFLHTSAIKTADKLNLSKDSDGHTYSECMQHKSSTAIECDKFYKSMLQIVHQNPAYKHLTLKELTSNEMWQRLSDEYLHLQFDTIN